MSLVSSGFSPTADALNGAGSTASGRAQLLALRCRETLRKLLVIVVLMGGFSYAMVPLYRVICEVTGINLLQKPDTLPANTQVDLSRSLSVQFDANVDQTLPWQFRPLAPQIEIHPGEIAHIEYEVTNRSPHPIYGQAIPSYAPLNAVLYFKKLECFCFTQQTLAPGETKRFPVVFVIDPAIPQDILTLTLSYTFFEVERPSANIRS